MTKSLQPKGVIGVNPDGNSDRNESGFMALKKDKKPRKTKPKPRKKNWVKEVLGQWADAAGKNDCDPLKINDAPEWVLNAYVECAKIVVPGGLPPAEKWDAEFVGTFLGRLNGLERLYAGEVPLGPETQTDLDRLKATVEKQPQPKNLRACLKNHVHRFKPVCAASDRSC